MDNKNFFEYIGNVFKPYVIKNKIKTPVIFFVDGHKTHLTVQTSQLCADSGIILTALYPNATRLMQPADVAAFRPLKGYWRETVLKFKRENPKKIRTKAEFAPCLKDTINMLTREVVQSGFRACGLYPWNPSALDYSKCLGKSHSEVVPDADNIKTDTKTISFEQFKSLVGPTKILELKNAHEDTDKTDDFRILSAIFKEFTTTKNVFNDGYQRKPNETDIDNQDQVVTILQEDTQTEDVEPFEILDMDLDINELPIIVCDSKEISLINNDIVQTGVEENRDKETANISFNINEESCIISEELLTSHLVWPETPERKGKKKSEKLPFVLTSSDRQKIEQRKIEKKEEEDRRKKERQNERLKKKEIKEKYAKVQKKNQTKYTTRATPTSSVQFRSNNTFVPEKENSTSKQTKIDSIILKKGVKVHLPSNKGTTALKISPIQNQKTSPLLNENVDLAKKRLFQEDDKEESERGNKKIDIISDLLIMPSSSEFKNETTIIGMCYDCTYNITAKREGIKCKACLRTYHKKCARKKSNKDTYYCETCQMIYLP